jgi:hypothetical protein
LGRRRNAAIADQVAVGRLEFRLADGTDIFTEGSGTPHKGAKPRLRV